MRVLVPVLVLLLAWTSFSHADRSITTIGGVKVDLVGESGQIKLTAANSTSWTKLKWAKMEEIALNGNVLQSVNNFASQKDLDWAAPTQIAGPNGSTQTTITLAGPITVGNGVNAKSATLNVVVSLFSESVEVANGNTTVRVDVNNIKFDVRITNWPFQSDASRLAFGVTLQSQGGKGPATTTAILDDTTTGTSKAKRVTFGPGNIISPTNAIVDGVDKTINVTYTGETLTWIFPYFNSTLKYDPTMYAADTSSNSGTMVQPLVTVSVLTALVVAVFHA